MKKKVIQFLILGNIFAQAQTKMSATFQGSYDWGKKFALTNCQGTYLTELHWLPRVKTSFELGFEYSQPQFRSYTLSSMELDIFRKSINLLGIQYEQQNWELSARIQPEWSSYNNSGMRWNQLLGGVAIKFKFLKSNQLQLGIQKSTLWGAAKWYPQIAWLGHQGHWKWEIGFPKTKLTFYDAINRWEIIAQQNGSRFKSTKDDANGIIHGDYFSYSSTAVKGSFQHQFDRYFSVELHAGYLFSQTFSTWNASSESTELVKENGLTTGVSIKFKY